VVQRRDGAAVGLAAYVVAADADVMALKSWLARRLPGYMIPARLRFVPTIPRLPSHKLDVKAIEVMEAARAAEEGAAEAAAPTGGAPPSSVHRAVGRAWTALVDAGSFAADRAWDEAGGDSLKLLELHFLLEETLGARLPLDLFDPTMRPGTLIASIARHLAGAAAEVVSRDDDVRPLVCFCLGILGDDPGLAKMRSALVDCARWHVLAWPSWRETLVARARIDPFVAAITRQVEAASGGAPVWLAGYSFGAFIAFEVAQALRRAGHPPAGLLLLDGERATRFEASPSTRRDRIAQLARLAREKLRAEGLGAIGAQQIYNGLVRLGGFRLLRAIAAAASLTPRARYKVNADLAWVLRTSVLRDWTPQPLPDVRTVLFHTAESDVEIWRSLCQDLRIRPIPGDHLSMVADSGHRAVVAGLLRAALEAA
jgi:thioesterase domain-containing protein